MFGEDKPDAVTAILDDTYVDDVISGASTGAEASVLIRDLTPILGRGGFELGPWASNSPEVLEALPSHLHATGDVSLGDECLAQRALGVMWTPETDELAYKSKSAPVTVTKRVILSHVMSVFDPIGFLCGWLLTVRVLLQQLWKEELDWESSVPDEHRKRYQDWTRDLGQIDQIRIPRHLFNLAAGISDVEAHVFCDASQREFCAVAYFRWQLEGRPCPS